MKITTIHSRINLMLYITGFIFFLMLLLLYQISLQQEKLIIKESLIQLQNECTSLVENKTEMLNQVANDYTFWDDFVSQLKTQDTAWYSNNITTILKSFRIDYVAVFDTSFNLLHEASTPAIVIRSFISVETLRHLKEKRLMNYFQKAPEGMFEISGATVHTENDPTHMLTPPRGFLILARNWNKDFLATISKQRNAEVSIISVNDTLNKKEAFKTSAYLPLRNWENKVEAHFSLERSSTLLSLYRHITLYMLFTMLTAIIIIWLILNFTFSKWVSSPLKLVTKILDSEDNTLVDKLKQYPGEFKQIGTLFNDFIDQKKNLLHAKEKAQQSDLLKTAFLANMSHEIRTPMNGILGFAELMKEPKLSGEEQKEYVGIIEDSGKRMLNIINDIINISKIEAGHMELVLSDTNINEQLRFIHTFFQPEAQLKKLNLLFKTGLPDFEAYLRTDREKVYALLNNLVKNAIKFTNQGSIEVGYEKKGEFLEFSVRDTGIGIRAEQHNIIFERFRQASESLSRRYEGAGLGLSISKAYVEILGGQIWVSSEFGVGSVFYFTIPYLPVLTKIISSETTDFNRWESLNIIGLKILIAEDDPVSDLFLRKMIHSYAKEVLKVDSGLEAVEVCRQNPDIDLVLMDIQMPGIDGYEATRQIRLFNQDVIILAQTALALQGDREIALEAGCNDYLSKPISIDDFTTFIKNYFGNRV